MKKLLGISIVAMLAVTPMMANATGTQTAANLAATSGTEQNAIATTSYVKGAYNAVRAAHDAVVSDMTVADGTHYHITAGNSVKDNLVSLDTAVKANDDAIGTIGNLTGSANFDSTEAHANIVEAINTVKAQANETDSLIGTTEAALNSIFDANVDTIGQALQALKNANADTDSKGVVVYNGWNGGQSPNGGAFVTLSDTSVMADVDTSTN